MARTTMRKRWLKPLVAAAAGLFGLAIAMQIAIGPPSEFEIAAGTLRLRRALEARHWPGLESMLDPQTCPFNRQYQNALQERLDRLPDSLIKVDALHAVLMKNVEPWRHVQGSAVLMYLDPQSGEIVETERLHFYLVKRYGRLWLDCGSG
jgi:hypothetical protein